MTIETTAGEVVVEAPYGQDRQTGQWLSPTRERFGLGPHQRLSPVLEEKLCFTATLTNSYEKAAAIAAKWGAAADDATLHRHVQQRGGQAEALGEERTRRAVCVRTRAEVIAEAKGDLPRGRFSLVLMMDGWMVRERGPQWGLKPRENKADRVAWHEMKTGIVFRLADRAQSQSGRRMILEKFYVASRGDPFAFGRRLYAEALRRGLAQAAEVFVVADGALWIWNLVNDRFSQARGVLDFYHASEHLWAVAHDLFGEGSGEARAWIEPLLHQLKHGGEAGVLETLGDLLTLCAERGETAPQSLEREVSYFNNHRDHLHYQRIQSRGCPIGSGAMESTCSQLQDRFKRTGQFWTLPGERHLLALELARRNLDWEEIWPFETQQC
jgi:hypothetical protein